MAIFTGFKPTGLQKIANRLGYEGSLDNFENYLDQNPEKKRQMTVYEESAKQMAKGGVVKMQEGGALPRPLGIQAEAFEESMRPAAGPTASNIEDYSVQQTMNPMLPAGGATAVSGVPVTEQQNVPTGSGQVSGTVQASPTTKATTTESVTPATTQANVMTATKATSDVNNALSTVEAAKINPDDPRAKVLAAQQTATSVGNLNAAQGIITKIENPVQRQIQDGELVSESANAEKASQFTEQVQAATATPTEKATVQGQLATLTSNFDGSNPPPWAAGALRAIQEKMAQRGMGASSMAAQAMIQGALESAIPIAQADAQVQAQFETQNLSNRQQRAMLAAQQRAQFIGQEFDQAFQSRVQNAAKIADVANMNFNAEQTIALENSRLAQSVNMANLTNRQAMVMAEAAALSQLDTANLSNRQQSAVQNAQSFLQMETANLNNNQQMEMFKAQSNVQSLFTDQAAENASRQFNATSSNQTDQFFASLQSQVANFNAEQANAMSRYNAGEENALEKFNTTMKNQREQFNAQNRLVIDQSNAQWRRQIATVDTAAINRANEINAKAILDVSSSAYNNLWQGFRDNMEFAWKSSDNALERAKDITLRKMEDEANVASAALKADQENANNLASGLVSIATSNTGSKLIGDAIGWVSELF